MPIDPFLHLHFTLGRKNSHTDWSQCQKSVVLISNFALFSQLDGNTDRRKECLEVCHSFWREKEKKFPLFPIKLAKGHIKPQHQRKRTSFLCVSRFLVNYAAFNSQRFSNWKLPLLWATVGRWMAFHNNFWFPNFDFSMKTINKSLHFPFSSWPQFNPGYHLKSRFSTLWPYSTRRFWRWLMHLLMN